MTGRTITIACGLLLSLGACGDPSCPTGYTLNAAKTLCISADAGTDATAAEICDPTGRDEDGNPATLGPDGDGDGFPSTACCNTQPGGALLCGSDCNDTDAMLHPGATETCDAVDNDCDGIADGPAANAWCSAPSRLPPHTSAATCLAGTCTASMCADTHLDCTPSPGCETDGEPDSANCGRCGLRCEHPICASSACVADLVEAEGGANFTCGLRASGTAACWGRNARGELGTGTTVSSPTPVGVFGIMGGAHVTAGGSHACVVSPSGSIVCWGANDHGELGDGTLVDHMMPVVVHGVTTATQAAAGGGHTCAVTADHQVSCWGDNGFGQLGDGSTTARLTAVAVAGISTATKVVAGELSSCALLSDGTVRCWGLNDVGQLGDGSTSDAHSPVTALGVSDVLDISLTASHVCVATIDGAVRCWGDNSFGQLGDGTTVNRSAAVTVAGISDGVLVAAGSGKGHTCIVRRTGDVSCWGANTRGQLGTGTTINSNTPVAVSGVHDAIAVTAGGDATCVRRLSGAMWCWGANTSGQVGDGTTVDRSVATMVHDP